MTRFVPVTVLVMVLAASRVAGADATETTLPGGGTLAFSELKIHEDNGDLAFPKDSPNSEWHYFNLAHCQCGAPGISNKADYNELDFSYLVTVKDEPTPGTGQSVTVAVGIQCSITDRRDDSCHDIGPAGNVDTIKNTNGFVAQIPLYDLMVPTPIPTTGRDAALCASTGSAQATDTIWLLADTVGGNGDPDYSATQSVTTDTGPPDMPTNLRATGGEGAIQLSWTAPTDTSDTYAYQALCARADDGTPGKASGRPERLYDTAMTLCDATDAKVAVELTAVDLPVSDVEPPPTPFTPTGALKNLDGSFLCGEVINGTSTGLRISGLENGVEYDVILLAMDKFGNARGRYFTTAITPVPSIDFWEDLHKRGGDIDGGLCLLAETYGDSSSLTSALRGFRDDTLGGSRVGRWLTDAYYATLGKLGGLVHGSAIARVVAGVVLAPVVALALAWHWLTLPGVLALLAAAWWLRRSGRRLLRARTSQLAAGVAVIALGASHARAGGYQPYWENSNLESSENLAEADDPSLVDWHVGVRVGPYIPDIDKQFSGNPGPYKQMYGGYHILAMLDVDRVLWSGFGQAGVGISVGYWQKRARAFTTGSMETDVDRTRGADETKFRLIPTALTGTYRLTYLDDEYGIPVIPYVRAGLSYYVWWMTGADGSFSTVCKDGSDKDTNPACSKNKAYGASLGLQGSIGLSIRAERIDSSTATSMRQSGIQHAGIYGELSIAKVDGFGSDTKLSVGDRTWFAGVDFEF